MGMDRIPDNGSMENPPQNPPLAGLNPADLLKQGAMEDTLGSPYAFQPPTLEEMAALFPQFEILELIGKGGMGAVYKVRQKELDRIVALKILPPAIGQSPAFSNRFTREAKALAKLNHPCIVTLHEFGQTAGLYFILMEYVDGVNLGQLMHTGRISPREALAIVPQICDALQFAHDQGIVHRDIKPENILLDRLGRVKVADFGIAKVVAAVNEEHGQECPRPQGGGDIPVPILETIAGNLMGTPQYMAPEQIEHPADVDHRADIYALGVVFYQMLTGELPGKELQAPSRKVQIDVRLDEIVLRALEKEPEKRYQTAGEFRTLMEGLREPENATDKPSPGGNGGDALESYKAAKCPSLISPWFQSLIGLLLVLCLPGSLVFPYFQDTSGSTWHEEDDVFTIPGQEDETRTMETLAETAALYQGIVLKVDSLNKKWKICATDADQTTARHKVSQACAAIQRKYDEGKTRKLAETIVWESSGSMSSSAMTIESRPAFIANLKKCLRAGLLLSAVGMLCLLVRRERRRFQFGNPVKVVLVLVMLGCFGCLFIPGPSRSPWDFLLFGGVLMGTSVIAVALGGRVMRFEFWMVVGTWVSTVAFLVADLPKGRARMDPGWKVVPLPVIQTRPQTVIPDVGAAAGKEPMDGRYLEAVLEWLGEIDAGRYEKAWSEAAAFARMLESPSQWATKMNAIRTPQGKLLSRTLQRSQWTSKLSDAPEGEYLIYSFRTEFTQGPAMRETVTLMFEKDGNWRVMGYAIEKDLKLSENGANPAPGDRRNR